MFVQNKEETLKTLAQIQDAIENNAVSTINIYQLIELLTAFKYILITKDTD